MSAGAESHHAETHHAASHVYDASFFDYSEMGPHRSARRLIVLMNRHIRTVSVLDVGAGRGRGWPNGKPPEWMVPMWTRP